MAVYKIKYHAYETMYFWCRKKGKGLIPPGLVKQWLHNRRISLLKVVCSLKIVLNSVQPVNQNFPFN